jgi:hypothetical protein
MINTHFVNLYGVYFTEVFRGLPSVNLGKHRDNNSGHPLQLMAGSIAASFNPLKPSG